MDHIEFDVIESGGGGDGRSCQIVKIRSSKKRLVLYAQEPRGRRGPHGLE